MLRNGIDRYVTGSVGTNTNLTNISVWREIWSVTALYKGRNGKNGPLRQKMAKKKKNNFWYKKFENFKESVKKAEKIE